MKNVNRPVMKGMLSTSGIKIEIWNLAKNIDIGLAVLKNWKQSNKYEKIFVDALVIEDKSGN